MTSLIATTSREISTTSIVFDRRKIGDRARGHADAVADHERALDRRLVEQHRPVREVAHVPHRRNCGARTSKTRSSPAGCRPAFPATAAA